MLNASKYISAPNRLLAAALTVLLWVLPAIADTPRKITPVQPQKPSMTTREEKPDDGKPKSLVEQTDAQGNVIFIDTVTGLEWVDTLATKKTKGMIYPKLYAVTAGINIWDPVMRALGQHYGIGEVWVDLSIHNRFFPTAAIGLGQASMSPDGQNYTYRSPMAPYFKIGADYNILYNSDSRYQIHVGLRYGLSPFSYSIPSATLAPGYWDTPEIIEIPSENCTAGYVEVVAGLRVGLAKGFSLGWNVIYHSILHESKASYGKPMYIPGYGKRGSAFTGSFSISYTFMLPQKALPAEPATDTDAL